ncbi:MAG TPA: PxKF domain-containing protein [Pyrinomonadaceae bacterium]
MFLSLAISLSLLTPLVPAAFGARRGAAGTRPAAATTPARSAATAAPVALVFAPSISATKADAFPDPDSDGKALPGDTVTYTVQVANNGATDATGVAFSDTVDANTTLVPGSITTTPVAANDSYAAVGNVRISVPAAGGLTSNDSDPDGDALTASAPATSANGGDVSVSADGSFTYNPPAGFEGTDSFTYTVTDGDGPADSATVSINVSGMIWFVNASAPAGGDGRLTSPFNALTGPGSFDAVAADDQNDNIFLYTGPYAGGLALRSGQALIGAGSSAPLATVAGVAPLPPYSDPLPATGGANPVVGGAGGLSVATNNLIRGLTVSNTGGTGISGSAYGTLAVAETAVNSTGGPALSLDNGQLDASFQSLSSSASGSTGVSLTNVAANSSFSAGATTVNGAAGVGVHVSNVGAGSVVVFGATDVLGRNSTGVELDGVDGALAFGATNIPNPNGAGGYGVNLRNSAGAVTFASANVSDAKRTQAQVDADNDLIPDNDGNGDAIFLKDNTGSFTLNGGVISRCDNDCVDARNSSNVSLFGVAISFPGVTASGASGSGGHGIQAVNLSGANSLTSVNVSNFNASGRDGLRLVNNAAAPMTMVVNSSTFSDATGGSGVSVTGRDAADMALTVQANSVFQNLAGAAVSHLAGANTDSTATVNLTVLNSTFQNSAAGGQNTVHAQVLEGGKAAVLVSGNTFDNVARTLSDNAGVIDVNGDALKPGNSLSVAVTNNTVTNIGTSAACLAPAVALPCLGRRAVDVFIDDNTNVAGSIVIDGNHLSNVQRAGIVLDVSNIFNGGNVAAKVTNNTVGTSAARVGLGTALSAGGELGVSIQNRSANGKSLNLNFSGNTVRNGNGGSGSALNTPGVFLRAQNSASMSATLTGNDIETSTSTTVAELRVDTSVGSPTLCLDVNGNTLDGGAGRVALNQTSGAFNVEQASAAAVAAANGVPAGNVTVAGSPQFGVACAAPPLAMFRTEAGRGQLAALSSPSPKAAQGFSYLMGARAVASELLPGLGAWRAGSKSRLGGLSFRYAAADVALSAGSADRVVRPAREASPASPAYAPAPAPLFYSGETISLNIGTLPAGKAITIKFQATIDGSINSTQVSNQGQVSGANFPTVLTDDPDTGAFGDPTVTQVGSPATISCPADISVNTDPGQFSASVAFSVTAGGAPAPAVDCKVGATSVTSPHTFPVGTTQVQCTATNGVGSPASCSFNVTVADNQTPAINCPGNITTGTSAGSCDASVNVGTPSVSDNDPNVSVSGARSDNAALSAPYPKGTTTITWTATDTAGNSASCQQTVTVNDDDAPAISCPADVVVTLPANSNALSAPVSFAAPSATDNCGGPVNVTTSHASGSQFPLGTTTVTATATDAAGNTASCSFNVTVRYNFTGFFSPVANLPTFNSVKAGQSIPVKFSLGGDKGLNIFAAGYPASGVIACGSSNDANVIDETQTAGGSGLQYDAATNTYTYVWKTEKTWKDTCRQLVIQLNDGTFHRANFQFK